MRQWWRHPEDFALWCAAVGLSAGAGIVAVRTDTIGSRWAEMSAESTVLDPLLWMMPAAVVATLVAFVRPLMVGYVGMKVLTLGLDLQMLNDVRRFDRKGCEECFASLVASWLVDFGFVILLAVYLLIWLALKVRGGSARRGPQPAPNVVSRPHEIPLESRSTWYGRLIPTARRVEPPGVGSHPDFVGATDAHLGFEHDELLLDRAPPDSRLVQFDSGGWLYLLEVDDEWYGLFTEVVVNGVVRCAPVSIDGLARRDIAPDVYTLEGWARRAPTSG